MSTRSDWHSLSPCLDIDECAANTHDCAAEANCTNNEGSFICTCPDGFQGNGTKCQGKNIYWECVTVSFSLHSHIYSADLSKAQLEESCLAPKKRWANWTRDQTVQVRVLAKFNAFSVLSCHIFSFKFQWVRFIDEGSLNFRNVNTSGSSISTWHSLSPYLDIDECAANTHDCTAEANCSNSKGSFICTCSDGFEGNGNTCQGKNTYMTRKRCRCCCLHTHIQSAYISKRSLKRRSDVKRPSRDKFRHWLLV